MKFVEYMSTFIDKKRLFALIILVSAGSSIRAQDVRVVDYNALESIIKTRSDTARIINLWATWCQPCLDEMPLFIKEQGRWQGSPISFIFVSVDFQSQEQKVKRKATELKLPGTVVQLEEKGNEWIDKLDKNWSGAIPYTILVLPGGKKLEHYDAFGSLQELDSFLSKNLTQ